MNEMERKGQLIKKYILSLVYEDEVPEIVNAAIDELVQAAQQSVQPTAGAGRAAAAVGALAGMVAPAQR